MRFIYLSIIILAQACLGCNGFIEELGKDKLPELESKLAVSCYISPQSPVISVVVTQSQPLFGPATYNPVYIANAEVILSSNTGQIRIPYHDSTEHYYIESSAFKIYPGQTYTLSVDDGSRFVTASCTVPTKAPELREVTVEKLPTNYSQDSLLQIRASWQDIKGEKNTYSVRGFYEQQITDLKYDLVTGDSKPVRRTIDFEFNFHPLLKNLYSDTNLDGAIFNMSEYNSVFMQRDTIRYLDKDGIQHSFYNDAKINEVRVEVMNMDEHYYNFLRSTSNYKSDNSFTEPTPIYTNIKGGLGCFGAYNAAVFLDKSGW